VRFAFVTRRTRASRTWYPRYRASAAVKSDRIEFTLDGHPRGSASVAASGIARHVFTLLAVKVFL